MVVEQLYNAQKVIVRCCCRATNTTPLKQASRLSATAGSHYLHVVCMHSFTQSIAKQISTSHVIIPFFVYLWMARFQRTYFFSMIAWVEIAPCSNGTQPDSAHVNLSKPSSVPKLETSFLAHFLCQDSTSCFYCASWWCPSFLGWDSTRKGP